MNMIHVFSGKKIIFIGEVNFTCAFIRQKPNAIMLIDRRLLLIFMNKKKFSS